MRPLRPQIEKTSPGRKGRNPPQAGPLGRDVPWILQSASCHESEGWDLLFTLCPTWSLPSLYGFGQKSTRVCEEPALYRRIIRGRSQSGRAHLLASQPSTSFLCQLSLRQVPRKTLRSSLVTCGPKRSSGSTISGSNGSPRSNTGKSRRAPKGKTQARFNRWLLEARERQITSARFSI